MMTLYIAGPMRYYRYYNFPAFMEAELRLKAAGFQTVNPARLDLDRGFDPRNLPVDYNWSKLPDGFDIRPIVREDIHHLCDCDGVALLPGWELSKGARAEHHVAHWLGIPQTSVNDWVNGYDGFIPNA